MKSKYLVLIPFLFLLSFCSDVRNEDIVKYNRALEYAKENKEELQKVISYYSSQSSDSLKLEAAYYLIGNMIGKGYFTFQAVDDAGNHSLFDMFSYKDPNKALAEKSKFEIQTGTKIRYVPSEFKEDIKIISADEIIENIDYAFKTYELPWVNKDVSFDFFKEYILPHRISNEPLQRWRKEHFEKIQSLLKDIDSKASYVEIASIINDSLRMQYRYFHDAITYFPGQFTIKEAEDLGGGRCEDLNMLTGYLLRAAGIPVAHEFTTYWGNSNNGGHGWLGIYNPDKNNFVPMNAIYDNPVLDSLPFAGAHLAKAFRHQYKNKIDDKNTVSNFASIDITAEYLPVSDVEVKINSPASENIFIGVLNGNSWKPVDSAVQLSGNSAHFSKIAHGILYCPIVNHGRGFTEAIGTPFLLDETGDMTSIVPDTSELITVEFKVNRMLSRLHKQECQIIYLDNKSQRWIKTGVPKVLDLDPRAVENENRTIEFDNVIGNAIYRIIRVDDPIDTFESGRPFIFDPVSKTFKDF